MKSDIIIVLRKNGAVVETIGPHAQAEGHPGISDWFEGFLGDIWNAITKQTFLSLLGGMLGTILPGSQILVLYQQAKQVANDSQAIIDSLIGEAKYKYQAAATYTLDETDEFDEILLQYHAYSEDEIKYFKHISRKYLE